MITALGLYGCGSDGGTIPLIDPLGSGNSRILDPGGNTDIFSNPGDPLIAVETEPGTGRRAFYFGSKDAEGLATRISSVIVDAEGLDPAMQLQATLDEQGRILRGVLGDGSIMTFQYLEGTKALISILLPGGNEEFRTLFDFDEAAADLAAAAMSHHRSRPGRRRNRAKQSGRHFIPAPHAAHAAPAGSPAPQATGLSRVTGNATGTVRVVCGTTPIGGAYVAGNYARSEGPLQLYPLPFREVETGVFEYQLPVAAFSPEDESALLDALERAINLVCAGALAVGVARARICARFTDARAVAVCAAVIGAYIWICRGNSARRAIRWIYDSFTKERFAVNITASHPKFGSKTVQVNVIPQSEPLPAAEVSFGERAIINSVTTTPVDPAPNEDYMFIVETFCAAPGTQVELSIVGTDGYTDSEIDSLDGSTTQAALGVPGAEERVVDTLTARFLPDGDQRVITIVF